MPSLSSFFRRVASVRSRITRVFVFSLKLFFRNYSDSTKIGLSVYDLYTSSVSYNIFEFLEHQQQSLERNGYQAGHLAVIFNPNDTSLVDVSGIQWKLINIIQPALSLYPFFSSYETSTDYASISFLPSRKDTLALCRQHPYLNSIELYKQFLTRPSSLIGIKLPDVAADLAFKYCSRHNLVLSDLVIITLRQTSWDPARNSSLYDWNLFAEYLTQNEIPYAVIPDFDHPSIDASLYPYLRANMLVEPCWNILLRAALYAHCLVHFCIPNGPSILSVLNPSSRYIFLNFLPVGSISTTYDVLERHDLHKLDCRYVFCSQHQYVYYDSDSYENILSSFLSFASSYSEFPGKANLNLKA